MSQPAASPATFESAHTSTAPDTRLHGRWLVLARLGWVVLVLAMLALFVGSLPAYYAIVQVPCHGLECGSLGGVLDAKGLQTLQAAGFSITSYAVFNIVSTLAIELIWAAVGFLIFWRRSDDWIALLVAFMLVAYYAAGQGQSTGALLYTDPAWTAPVDIIAFLSQAALVLFVCLFPSGRFAPRWMRWILVPFLIQSILSIFPPTASLFNGGNGSAVLGTLVDLGFFATALFSQIYRYRRVSTPVQRQQTKWVLFGIVLTLVLLSGLFVVPLLLPSSYHPGFVVEVGINLLWSLFLLPIPIFIGLAITRSRLWDIDAIINKALVYGLLTGLLGALYAGLIIGLENLAGLLGGTAGQNPIVLVVSTLAIAALFQPARRRIQNVIDRRFYRRKYDAEKTLAAFSATLRNEVDLEQIRERLLAVVQETMQPAHVSLWLRPLDGHARGAALSDRVMGTSVQGTEPGD